MKGVEIKSHNWAGVAFVNIILVKTSFRPGAVVTVCLVYISFFGTDPESCSLVIRKIEGCDCNFASLVVTCVYKFQCFLTYVSVLLHHENKYTHLGLSQHVHEPTTHHTVRTAGNKIVCVLGANHLHRIDRVCVSCR